MYIKRKEIGMKVLKRNNNKGYYVLNNEDFQIIDIDKDDIFKILNVIYGCDDEIEMDEENDQNKILNEAEKVIYKGIYEYLNSFIDKKADIKKEIEEEFSEIREILEEQSSTTINEE